MMGLLREFKQFAIKGNVIDLAVAVVIGAAFGKIISSFVEDLIMPLINPLVPKGGWQNLVIGPGIRIGSFLSVVLNFFIVAFALFIIVHAINVYKRRQAAREEALVPTVPPTTTTDQLLIEIRDVLKTSQSQQ